MNNKKKNQFSAPVAVTPTPVIPTAAPIVPIVPVQSTALRADISHDTVTIESNAAAEYNDNDGYVYKKPVH